MQRKCHGCGGPLCHYCGGCITEGECNCVSDGQKMTPITIRDDLGMDEDSFRHLAEAVSCGYCGTMTKIDSGYQCRCGRILCPECGKRWGWCRDHMPVCNHPELRPTAWNQPQPGPAKMIGSCQHNMTCPICGFGWASWPDPCDSQDV